MKKVMIAALLFLAACGGTRTVYVVNTDAPDTSAPKRTTDAPIATPAPTLPPSTWTVEDEFLFDIQDSYFGTIYISESEMIETGRLTCEALLNGASGEDVLWAIVGAGGDTEFISAVVASAVVNFCPSQAWKFETLR